MIQKKAWRRGHREECKRIERERKEEEEKKRTKEEAVIRVERGRSAMAAEDIMEAEVL